MKHSDKAVSELAFLFKLSPVMHEVDSVDKIYRLLLAIATAAETVGHRRAMLFVVDEREGAIRGRFGVERPRVPDLQKTFEAGANAVFSAYEGVESSDLTLQARSFTVPMAWHRSALVKAVRSSHPVLAERQISEFATDPFFDFFDTSNYVAVPIRINGRNAAVIAADKGPRGDRSNADDIAILYALTQQASEAAKKLLDLSDHERRARIVWKLQRKLQTAGTAGELDEAVRLALIMISRAVGGSGCLIKDLTRQKTTHVKTVHEHSPEASDDDAGISLALDAVLDHVTGTVEPIKGDSRHPRLGDAAATIGEFYATPLVSGREVAGALGVYTESSESGAPRPLTVADRHFVELCAGAIAARLEAAQLAGRVARLETFLEDVHSNLARERERSRLAERSFDYQLRIAGDLEAIHDLLSQKGPAGKRTSTIKRIVKDMQLYSQEHVRGTLQDTSHFELVDVFEATRTVIEKLEPEAVQAGVDVTVRIPRKGPSLLMDREKVTLAIENILKATMACLSKNNKMLVECSTDENRVIVCVADNGLGVPGDAMSRLFLPFDAALGPDERQRALSLAGEIIQKHGGEILIKSSMSWKTILVLSFPRAANRDRRRTRRDRRRHDERRLSGSRSE